MVSAEASGQQETFNPDLLLSNEKGDWEFHPQAVASHLGRTQSRPPNSIESKDVQTVLWGRGGHRNASRAREAHFLNCKKKFYTPHLISLLFQDLKRERSTNSKDRELVSGSSPSRTDQVWSSNPDGLEVGWLPSGWIL